MASGKCLWACFSIPHKYIYVICRRPQAAFSSPSSQTKKKNSRKKTHASVTVTVVRDRKIRTALRTNQIVRFVTVPAWKIFLCLMGDVLFVWTAVSNMFSARMSTALAQRLVSIDTASCLRTSLVQCSKNGERRNSFGGRCLKWGDSYRRNAES